jgi:hypothetical protein
MNRPHLSLEEFSVRAGHEVLIEVDDNPSLIVGDPQAILDLQLWPGHVLNTLLFY